MTSPRRSQVLLLFLSLAILFIGCRVPEGFSGDLGAPGGFSGSGENPLGEVGSGGVVVRDSGTILKDASISGDPDTLDWGGGGIMGSGGIMGTGGVLGTGGTVADTAGEVIDARGQQDAAGSEGSMVQSCDRATWSFVPNFLCDTPTCANITTDQKHPKGAIDGNPATRWTSGRGQGGTEMVTLSFVSTININGVSLMTTVAGDGPAMYRVEHSADGTTFVQFVPAITGPGSDTLTIQFPTTAMRAVRVLQIGTKGRGWSINEMSILGCVAP